MRLFLGLDPGRTLRPDLLALQERFSGPEFAFLRMVPEGNLHLTLHFLGETGPERLGELEEILARGCELGRPIKLAPKELGAFPGPKRARGLELRLEDPTLALEELQQLLGQLLRRGGFPVEERAFRPHITLARVKGKRPRRLDPSDFPRTGLPVGSYSLIRAHLYRSELGSGGARYSSLRCCKIGNDAEAE